MDKIEQLNDGIYFDLDKEIYLAQERLGSGSLGKLLVSPADFWASSWLNPNYEPKDPAHFVVGDAYHAARFEPDRFQSEFVREIDKGDFSDGLLSTDTEIKAALKDLGLPQSGKAEDASGNVIAEGVLDRARRLRAAGYQGAIWHLEQEAWQASLDGRRAVPANAWADIIADGNRFWSNEQIRERIDGGFAEVTVLWHDAKGVPCKARFDKLREADFVDLKTFDNSRGKVLEQAMLDAFRFNRYYLQVAHYHDAAEAIRLGDLPIIFGDAVTGQRDLIHQIRARPIPLDAWLIFQQKGGVPNLLARQVELFSIPIETEMLRGSSSPAEWHALLKLTARPSALFQRGAFDIAKAKHDFMAYQEIYGPGEEWRPFNPIGKFTDDNFSQYWLEN